MIVYEDIKEVHLEISSLCNARCPLCPRNLNGYPHNDGYVEANMTLAQVQQIFSPDFLKQLKKIYINGNYGDAVMNPETPSIVEYFRQHNPTMIIQISSNASARDKTFWQRLGKTNSYVEFCLDGLEDTHHLYRINTNWRTILNNAKLFMEAGGHAIWKMIKFDHNLHQIEACEQLSKELGFYDFFLMDNGRNAGPVFDKQGNHVYTLGDYSGITDFNALYLQRTTEKCELANILPGITRKSNINCYSKRERSIYISSTGDVSPCCWLGFNPKTAGKGGYLEAVNSQIAPMIHMNNALEYPIETCIEWFNQVEQSWAIENFEDGRLVSCNDNCGFDK